MESEHAVAALSALAQRSRLAVFRWLVECGPAGAYPGDIVKRLDLPAATLSFHLKTLQQAGLVSAQQSSRHIRYTANFQLMQSLLAYLTDQCCGGDPGMCLPVAAASAACTSEETCSAGADCLPPVGSFNSRTNP